MKIVCLKCKETACGKIEILRFSPLTRGAGGLPPGPPERCAAQPRFFAFLVTEARRLDLIFLILNLSPGATNMRDSDFCPLKILSM